MGPGRAWPGRVLGLTNDVGQMILSRVRDISVCRFYMLPQ